MSDGTRWLRTLETQTHDARRQRMVEFGDDVRTNRQTAAMEKVGSSEWAGHSFERRNLMDRNGKLW